MARRRNKDAERHTARHRVRHLLQQAEQESLGPDDDLAQRHARLARRVAMRYQVPLPPTAKVHLCRSCGAYLVPGRTGRTRITQGRITTTCLACGQVRRRPLHARPPVQRRPDRTEESP